MKLTLIRTTSVQVLDEWEDDFVDEADLLGHFKEHQDDDEGGIAACMYVSIVSDDTKLVRHSETDTDPTTGIIHYPGMEG